VSKRRKQRKAAKRLVKLFREAVDQAVCAALDAWLDRPFAGPEIRSIGGCGGSGDGGGRPGGPGLIFGGDPKPKRPASGAAQAAS
jgi:hypothetical protein